MLPRVGRIIPTARRIKLWMEAGTQVWVQRAVLIQVSAKSTNTEISKKYYLFVVQRYIQFCLRKYKLLFQFQQC